MITSFLLKKKINPTSYSSNIEFWKKKKKTTPPTQPFEIKKTKKNFLKNPNNLNKIK